MKRASLYSSSRRPRGAVEGAAPSSKRTGQTSGSPAAGNGDNAGLDVSHASDAPRGESAVAEEAPRALRAGSSRGLAPGRRDPAPAVAATSRGAKQGDGPAGSAAGAAVQARWYRRPARYAAPVLAAIGGALLVMAMQGDLRNQRQLTQEDIDKAVLNTLETQQLPSAQARAARIIGPSVVRVQAFGPEEADPKAAAESEAQKGRARPLPKDAARDPRKDPQKSAKEEPKEELEEGPKEVQKGVGSGVVIKDSGLILTNLHVVSGAQRISVVFADGTESDVNLTGARPEHDLAVLQAVTLPDDLQPATLRSTGDLQEGDGVVAVGFPFDIGPSVSAGVISGFGREYRSTSGERILTNLIQFDAAANPGSSGGPLVTLDGEVVGIVTAILNPNNQRSFVGIGFAVPIENAAAAVGIPPH